MRNKKIAQTLKDAIDSPLGSTKRKAARNLIAVMTRVASKYDNSGSGGPGYTGQGGPGGAKYSSTSIGSASMATKAPRKDPDYSNMIIFPAPPAPRRGKPMTKAMQPPGQAGQSAQQQETLQLANQMGGGQMPTTQPSAPAQSGFNQYSQMPNSAGESFANVTGPGSIPAPGSGTGAASVGTLSQLQSSVQSALSGLGSKGQGGPGDQPFQFGSLAAPSTNFGSLSGIPSYSTPSLSDFKNLFSFPGMGTGTQTTTPAAPAKPATPAPISSVVPPNKSVVGGPAPLAGEPGGPPAAPATTTAPAVPGPVVPEKPAVPGSTTEMPGSTPSTTGPAPTGPSTGPKTAASIAASLKAGISGNMGATAWAQSAMGNKDLLKQIFPNDPNLPTSPSLSKALDDLSATLSQKYNIKGLESQLLQMTADGGLIGPMLQTYIQNKDTSLNAIHGQILHAQDQMLHSDTADPFQAAIWSRYGDYLNNVYTAQNASYADFFNKSTTLYSNALSAMNNTFTTALNQFNNELTTKTAGTEADYNRMYQALTDMYTTAQNAPVQEIQLQMLQDQAALAHKQLLALGSGSTTGQGDWVAEYKKLTDLGILFDNKTKAGDSSNANYGVLLPDVTSIGGMIQTIVSDNPKIGTDGALWIVGQAFQKSLQKPGSNADSAINEANKFQGMIVQGVSDGYLPASMGLQMTQALIPSVQKSIANSIANTTGADAVAKQAMTDALVGSGGWLSAKKVPSQADFQKKYGTTLGKSLTDAIYLQMKDTKSRLEAAQAATGGQGPGGTAPYAGMSMQQINQGFADEINKFATPQEVGDYVGSLVAPYITGKAIETLQPINPGA